MVISLFSQNLGFFGDLLDVPVRDLLSDLTEQLITMKDSEMVCHAFQKMVQSKASGIGIVDFEGKLVGNVSLRDLRGIGANGENFIRLWSTIATFKQHEKRDYNAQTPKKPIVVIPAESLRVLLERFYDGNLHRIYVVVSRVDDTPTHVITQLDVIRFVLFRCGLRYSKLNKD